MKTFQQSSLGCEPSRRWSKLTNGTEFTSNAILAWQQERDVEWHYIAPGKPMQNGSSRASTAGCETSASTSTCSRTSTSHVRSSKHGGIDYNTNRPHTSHKANSHELREMAPNLMLCRQDFTRSITTGTGRQTVLQTGECCWAYASRSSSSFSEQSALTSIRMRICS
jgi:hypothetical protein